MIQMIAHYEILGKLGSGSMGEVYRARDTVQDREVALKVLSGKFAFNPAYLHRFQREACTASALNHPNICAIYEIGKHEDLHYIAMELLDGQTLRGYLRGKPMPVDQILPLAIQIAEALKAAHDKGILHRDIKPGNIFIRARGQIKVVDFGLAKLSAAGRFAPDEETGKAAAPPRQIAVEYASSPHITIGALPYMSPEQALGEELDARSDLFSLGSVLYEMATGLPPFGGETQSVLFQEILTKMPAPPRKANPEIPPKLNELICRLLEKDRELRHQTAGDLCADLKRARRDLDQTRGALPGKSHPGAAQDAELEDLFPPPPDPASRRGGPCLHMAGFLRNLRESKIGKYAAYALAPAVVLAVYFILNRPTYFPYIAFEDFAGGSLSVDAQIVGFVLKRTLSQFPEVAVLDGKEFGNLLAVETSQKDSDGLQRPAPWWRQWFALGKRNLREPAVRISGRVNDSLGRLEVRLDCTVRGKEAPLSADFRGVDDLLNKGIDSMVLQILKRYDARIAQRHLEGSQEDYRTAVQLLSSRWDAVRHYHRGARAWQRRDIYTAERELRSALEVDPNLALARLMLGEMRVWQNQWDAAQSDILAARGKTNALLDVDQLRVEALLSRSFSEPFKERDYLHRLIGLQPYKGEYMYELAESYFHTADVDEAITRYLDAVKLDRNNALSYNHLAYCYAWKGEHDRALRTCRQYLELHQSANAYDSLGEIHLLAGDYDRAEQMKTKAIRMDPRIYYASRNLAFIEMLRGRNRAAVNRLKSLFPATNDKVQQTQFFAALAFLYYREGDLDAAANMCEQGANLLGSVRYEAPHDELIWISGMTAIRRGDLPAAHRALAELRRMLDDNSINAMNYKPAYKYWLHLQAWILAEEGREADAESAINDLKWIKFKLGYWNKPYDCAFFYDAIGQIYEKMKQPAEAEQAYRDSLAYNPHYALSRLHLARLLKEKRQDADARRELEAFWKEWQGADPDAVQSLEAGKLAAALQAAN